MRIAVIGTGRMGVALSGALAAAGYEVLAASRGPATAAIPVPHSSIADACGLADVAFLAVPADVALSLARTREKALAGKVIVDVSNPYFDRTEIAGGWKSAGEAIAAAFPRSGVAKAFNTVPAKLIRHPILGAVPVSLPMAGDSAEAKETVTEIATVLGFAPVDAGGIALSRELEALAVLLHCVGRQQGWGANVGFHVACGGTNESAPPQALAGSDRGRAEAQRRGIGVDEARALVD